jgi:16S rRNA (cytosine967-C5)-methyltransferase
MARPMTGKQRTVHYLIMVGFYQLLYTRIPAHAALAETVEGAVAIKRPQLKGLINGVLRQFQRQQEALLAEFAQSESRFLHPAWLLKRLQKSWPQQWQAIVDANNQRPPMWLRVNRNHHSRDEWLALLEEAGLQGLPTLIIRTPCVWPRRPRSRHYQDLTKAGLPSRMLQPRAVCAT